MAKSAFSPTNSASTGKDAQALGTLPEWDLTDFYASPDAPEVTADLKATIERCTAFEAKWKDKLAGTLAGENGAARLANAIAEFDAVADFLGRIGSYASLVYAGDMTDPARAKFAGDVQDKLTAAYSHLLFFTLELNRLEDDAVTQAAKDGALAHWLPWIEDTRRERPYQLEDRVEQLFHEKSATSAGSWNRLFDETIAGLRFDLGGQELTIEPTLNFLQDSDPSKREAAAGALANTFNANIRLFTLITNTLAKDKEISDRWRGFEDVADSRHLSNRVEREVVDALVAAVHEAYPRLSHRYYRLKANWFGRDQLDFWDRNAPLPQVSTRTIPWSEARKTVLDAYESFSPKLAEVAGTFFDRNWIDAPVRPGKAPGAFAHPTVPSVHPYVLLNYQGRPRDVMTLAHELGHGVHQVLAGPNGALMAPTPLTLAETASVFGEMLTFRSLLRATTDPAQKKALLASKVEDMLNTVVRQIAFYTFERKVHTERREGELRSERLNEIWLEVQAESLGPAIRLGTGYETFWTYIPHFIHSPFYVYAYAFGDCLVNSLYGVYETSHEGFAERYLAMLAAGGTKHHSELLAPFGLDARDRSFWQYGLGMIGGLIDELEALG